MKTLSLGAAALALIGAAGCTNAAIAHGTDAQGSGIAIGGNMTRTLDQDGDLSLIGGNMDFRGRVGGDVSLVGGNIDLDLEIGGELSVAGGNMEADGSIGEGASIAGGDIEWRAAVAEDLEIAGGDLTVDAAIGGDLEAASGEMVVTRASHIRGNAEIAAAEIEMDGQIDGTLEAAAAFMQISGEVGGEAWLMADPQEGRRGWRAEIDEDGARAGSTNGRVEISGEFGDALHVCARRVNFLRNASVAGPVHVWADAEPDIADAASLGPVSFEARNGRDCDDIFDDLGRR
jgi:hypothetical protein